MQKLRNHEIGGPGKNEKCHYDHCDFDLFRYSNFRLARVVKCHDELVDIIHVGINCGRHLSVRCAPRALIGSFRNRAHIIAIGLPERLQGMELRQNFLIGCGTEAELRVALLETF